MAKFSSLTAEDAYGFVCFLAESNYKVMITANCIAGDQCWSFRICDQCGDVLLQKYMPIDTDFEILMIRGLEDYITSGDGQDMYTIWNQ